MAVAKRKQSLHCFVSPANDLCAGTLQALAEKIFLLLSFMCLLCCISQIKRELNLESCVRFFEIDCLLCDLLSAEGRYLSHHKAFLKEDKI